MTPDLPTNDELTRFLHLGDPHADAIMRRVLAPVAPGRRLERFIASQEALVDDESAGREAQAALRDEVEDSLPGFRNSDALRPLEVALAAMQLAGAESRPDAVQSARERSLAALREARAALSDDGSSPPGDIRRGDYNHLLSITDRILRHPELMLVRNSALQQELDHFPQEIIDYFDPVPLPDWVDSAKLATASRIWKENMLAILGVLYSASLPYCYMIEHGIPLLYRTGKLLKSDFVYQRLYETGLMLDAVMGEEGLRIIPDLPDDLRRPYAEVVARLDQDPGRREHPSELPWTVIAAEANRVGTRPGTSGTGDRFVWGKGVLAVKKVRLLHAAMRCMALNPGQPGASGNGRFTPEHNDWQSDEFGAPINQVDLAFVLLTFGYVIPEGLARWGCHLSLREREAFLHSWRLVGHLIGIDPKLLTDRRADAAQLFRRLLKRRRGSSEEGVKLTEALFRFLDDYVPVPGLGPVLILDQLGPGNAQYIMDAASVLSKRRLPLRASWQVMKITLKGYYRIRQFLFHRFRLPRKILGHAFSEAGVAIVDSWRGSFQRRPFWIPAAINAPWQKKMGSTPGYRRKLARWRRYLFLAVASGVALLITGLLAGVASVFALLFQADSAFRIVASISGIAIIAGFSLVTFVTPAISRRRPALDPCPNSSNQDSNPPRDA